MATLSIDRLRIAHFMPRSRANGPGPRAVIWVQGCSLGCPGCFNPDTHSSTQGESMAVAEIFKWITDLENTIEGVTISGGEPLQQLAPLASLFRRIKDRTQLSTILFSGYTWDEIQAMPRRMFLDDVDVLIAGRYDQSRRIASGLRGSANKTTHLLTERYSLSEIETTPTAEIIISPDGSLTVSGINPPELPR